MQKTKSEKIEKFNYEIIKKVNNLIKSLKE